MIDSEGGRVAGGGGAGESGRSSNSDSGDGGSDSGSGSGSGSGNARISGGGTGTGRSSSSSNGGGGNSSDGDGTVLAPEERRRTQVAWRGAGKVLSRGSAERRIGERLADLVAHAGSVYDLDEPADVYGDGVVAELERRTARVLGTEAAVFFPTGTMAQQVALRCWAGRTGNSTVALHPRAHPEQHERGALHQVSGLRTVHPTAEPRLPSAEEVRDFDEPFGTLMLELPLRELGFVLPTWDELTAVVAAARERDAVVHFDGARLWECTAHFGRSLAEIAALADTVYVSFYKSLGGMSGAALAGPETLIDEARTWRHRYGGNLFQQYPAALSALLGLERELPRLPEYVAHAKVVAQALGEGFDAAGVPWFRVRPEVPHTHQFQVWLPYDADALTEASVRPAEETGVTLFRRWSPGDVPGISVTEVTVTSEGLEWSGADVVAAVAEFTGRLR